MVEDCDKILEKLFIVQQLTNGKWNSDLGNGCQESDDPDSTWESVTKAGVHLDQTPSLLYILMGMMP